MEICTYSLNDLKDQRLPASSWKHSKHIFSLDEVEQGFFLDRFQLKNIGKTTIHRKLYCTTKGSLEFVWSFFEQKKQLLGLLRSIPEIRPVRVLVRSLSLEKRSGAKFEHQSATEFKICTHGSEVRSCRDQRVFFCARHNRGFATQFLPQTTGKKPSGTQGNRIAKPLKLNWLIYQQLLWSINWYQFIICKF